MAVSLFSTQQLSLAAHPLSSHNHDSYLKKYPKVKCVDAYYPGLRSLAPCNWTAAIQLLVAVLDCEDRRTSPVSDAGFLSSPKDDMIWWYHSYSYCYYLLVIGKITQFTYHYQRNDQTEQGPMDYLPWLLSVHHCPGKRYRPIHHSNCKACGASLPILQTSTCKHLSLYYLRAREETGIENVFLSSSKDRVRKRVRKCEQNLSGLRCESFSSNLRILQWVPLDRSPAHLSQLTSLDHLRQLRRTAESFL